MSSIPKEGNLQLSENLWGFIVLKRTEGLI